MGIGPDCYRPVLLITSRETRRWVLPKGWPRPGTPPHRQAAREALEEAGVIGRVGRTPIGYYQYAKRPALRVRRGARGSATPATSLPRLAPPSPPP